MDEKKALKELKLQSLVLESRIQCNREIEEFVSSALLEQRKNAIDIGIKALEKQIAKPVKGKSATHEGSVANCPSCNKFIRIAENKFYCDCGQKLEW